MLKKHFIYNISVTLVVNLAGALLMMMLNIMLGRKLGAEDYGFFNVTLSISAIMGLFFTFGFHNSCFRYISEYIENKNWILLKGFISFSLLCSTIFSILFGILGIIASELIDFTSYHQSVVFVVSVLLLSFAILPVLSKMIRGFGSMFSSLWPEQLLLPSLIISILFFIDTVQFTEAALAYIAGRYLVVIISLILVKKELFSIIPTVKAQYHGWVWLQTSFPLLLGGLIQTYFSKIDSVFVGSLSSMSQAGLYSAASKIAMLLSFVLAVVEMAVTPMLSNAYQTQRMKDFKTLFAYSTIISATISGILFVIIIFFGKKILLFFGAEFEGAFTILLILSFTQFVNALTGPVSFSLMVSGKEKVYGNIMFCGLCINVLLSFLLIRDFGGIGAAIATLITVVFINLTMLRCVITNVLSLREI